MWTEKGPCSQCPRHPSKVKVDSVGDDLFRENIHRSGMLCSTESVVSVGVNLYCMMVLVSTGAFTQPREFLGRLKICPACPFVLEGVYPIKKMGVETPFFKKKS